MEKGTNFFEEYSLLIGFLLLAFVIIISVLNICKDFMGDAFPYMFEFQQGEDIIAVRLAKSGLVGWSVIAVLFALPILIILCPRVKKY